ncbi:MAG TPA: response regulator [Sediminibacterium sp.]|nr:response regulator [Sediminibacterium sp.]
MKILVAEDEPLLLKTIELKLKKEGYEVLTATDGRAAIAAIQEQEPDMVITDIMMPYASGLEIVSVVQKGAKKIPTIILSAMEQEQVVMEAFELGADDYITKPFSLNEMVMRVKKLTIRMKS